MPAMVAEVLTDRQWEALGQKYRRKAIGDAVRVVLSFVFASAFLAGGVFLLLHQAFIAKFLTMDGIGLGITLTFIGGAWLWADFVRPVLRGDKIG